MHQAIVKLSELPRLIRRCRPGDSPINIVSTVPHCYSELTVSLILRTSLLVSMRFDSC